MTIEGSSLDDMSDKWFDPIASDKLPDVPEEVLKKERDEAFRKAMEDVKAFPPATGWATGGSGYVTNQPYWVTTTTGTTADFGGHMTVNYGTGSFQRVNDTVMPLTFASYDDDGELDGAIS